MSEQASAGGSLADRISKPETLNAQADSFQPKSGTSWADDVESPVAEEPVATSNLDAKSAPEPSAAASQVDGATEPFGGSQLQEPEYEVNVKLADMQADPDNPLYSATSFEQLGLSEEILKGVMSMNFRKPSKVQERTLPLLLINPPQNLIGQSQSGTGKTAAFVLNILHRIDLSTEQMQKTPQALVLAPSRELARQIQGVVKVMGSFMQGLIVEAAVPQDAAARSRKIEASVIVGTPGTTMDMIRKRSMDVKQLKVLVLDEADNMLDQQGLGDQCIRVKSMLPKGIQIILFSATFPDTVIKYAQNFAPGANQMTLQHEDLTVEGIKQIYLDCEGDQAKYDALVKFYGLLTIGSSIIFVKTRETALAIEQRMTAEGHKVVSLTGGYEGAQRDVIIDSFRMGHAKVLITTNVLARGIDVQSVSMVVNYDVPDKFVGHGKFVADPQTYLHRIGRTGRFGRVGVAVTFISSRYDWDKLMEIQKYFNTTMTKVATDDWDELEETVSKIIKSSRAGTNWKEGANMRG
ncbi:RNA helicase required for poly(A+) mRNA export [Exophiala xenobiotica]|uniref:RNA helicase n=1 Tax=Vermiconidia calcicola TaxID=1690605 RepID=A0AAV9PW38_9PEZI|nr:RNA helicase required for poly(A+) mRNA export [Exophiala xenobiotica]KAK5529807.1 RNA helicase required for poly(A+) mRNA export [Vermiconidia calcicola]KAK5548988.1 RNA helicase required for poly(A+) mRNA export [Chaetothyriales sp. CCFEE 6169]KAK5224125.1 RNA helicase required for poly(A+) mRNA export [Exophiala xenobiotica]KAK5245597.1 RNA helicase required for poly(A+) mRNA export [Exophiala xenobiotica]